MSRLSSVVAGLVAIAIVVVALQITAPADAMGCATANPSELQYDDGSWLVLRVGGCTEGLHVYDGGWQNRTELHLSRQVNETYGYPEFVTFTSGSGGWWFISKEGQAYRFSEDLQYQNQTLTLPVDRSEYLMDVEVDGTSQWWITTRSETRVYDSDENETTRTFDQSGTNLVIRDQRVWILTNGRKGGVVHEYAVRERGGRPTLHEQGTREIGPEVFHPSVLTRGPDGKWWVYSTYRRAFVYDRNWRYIGRGDSLGSVLHGAFFLFPALAISLLGFCLLALAIWRYDLPEDLLLNYFGGATFTALLAISVRESLLPAALSVVYWPPDRVVAALLLGPTAGGILLLERRSWFRVLLVALANAPLFVVAWDFVTSVS